VQVRTGMSERAADCFFFVGAVVLIGLRAANTKGEPPGLTPTEITGEVNDTAGSALNKEETTFPG
jgi:hypothetical protein